MLAAGWDGDAIRSRILLTVGVKYFSGICGYLKNKVDRMPPSAY